MKIVLMILLASGAALRASGCTRGAEAAADTAKIADGIKAGEAQWMKDYASKDINAVAAHYADDAVLVAPGEALATTDVERRKALQEMMTDASFKLDFAPDRVTVSSGGDLASSRGHYSLTMTDKATGKAADSSGTYLTVYKKQSDGSWKATEDAIIPGPAEKAAK